MAKVNKDYAHLTHCRADIVGKINAEFYIRTKGSNSVDYKVMK